MKKFTQKQYWESSYKKSEKSLARKGMSLTYLTSTSFYFYDLTNTIKEYLPKHGKIIEIGCAPGNIIIALARKFNLEPFGIDYSEAGVKITRSNFEKNGFKPGNVIRGDFFSKEFLKKNKQKYDVVCSFGFAEHFDDMFGVIDLHVLLLKKGGTLIVFIPNLSKTNRFFVPEKTLEKHNLEMTNMREFSKYKNEQVHIRKISYVGGPFNIGLFVYKSKLANMLRMILYGIQRLVFEPFIYLGSKLGINLNNAAFSPGIALIAKRT
jgi:2-polyprenyl-3-methyl-5-hydroxy-6-metoxy-1,4-benzoquinol methylase